MLRRAQHERDGEVHRLKRHPATPARNVVSVTCEWLANDGNGVSLTFVVIGTDTLVVPGRSTPGCADELWRTTCFEMFWRAEGADGYVELNLSPSGRWAAYGFDSYRSGMRNQPMAVDPHIETERSETKLVSNIDVDFATLPGGAVSLNLTAVIEETDGTKSYWALAHPDGPPDFHDPACFVLALPAPNAA